MKNYPAIVGTPILFLVTILGFDVPKIADQVYVLGSSQLQIVYNPFEVLPKNYEPGLNTIQAYFFDSYVGPLPAYIDLACDCLVPINSASSWITFNPLDRTLLVQTTDSKAVGLYSVVLVQSFVNFPKV